MEFVIITASTTMKEDIQLQLKENGITGYTLFPSIFGSGQVGGTRLGSDVWPGENIAYMLYITTEQYKAICDWIKEYRKDDIREGIKLFSLALKEMI